MNPMAAAAIGSVVRWALAFAAGYLIRAGVWSAPNAEMYVTAATLAIVSLAWSQWQKYAARRVLLVALASTRRLAEQEAASLVALAPPVTTPETVVPMLAEKG